MIHINSNTLENNINNANDINLKEDNNINKQEINDNTQNISNKEENNNINDNENLKEEEQENDCENNKIWNGLDLNTLTVDKLKEELKNRNIDFPKNAKKKDLQELLINSNTK